MSEDKMKTNDIKENDRKRDNCIFSEDFCAALDSCNIPIYIIDPENFEILYCNTILSNNIGFTPVTHHCYKALKGMDEPCKNCTAMRLYKFNDNTPVEVKTRTGVWMLIQASPLNWKGRKLIQINCININKQKKLEEELRLFNEEYGAVVRQSITGVMRYDIASDTAATNVDAELNRVDECIIHDYVKTVRESGLIDVQSHSEAKNLLSDIKKGVPSKGYDLLMNLRSGNKRWCHIDYVLIRNEQGEPYRAVVSFFDSTEQKEREAAYKKWNERIKSIINEQTAFIEVNLTHDTIESEGTIDEWDKLSGGRCFSKYISEMVRTNSIYEDDKFDYIRFFDRERLMGLYYADINKGALEYRLITKTGPKWFRAEFELIIAPHSKDIKATFVFKNIDENMRERERLENEAHRDSMTGLLNHAEVERRVRKILNNGKTDELCCFLVIDLDDLRGINSKLGHPQGDRALKAIADNMKAEFGAGSILGRIGGDEFVVLLRDVRDSLSLRKTVLNFMKKFDDIKIGVNDDTPIHVSVGGAVGTVGKCEFKTLYEQADLALYYTKATGKNAFNIYTPELEKRNFTYQPIATVTLHHEEWYDSEEFKKMLKALSAYYPLIIYANLSQNSYYMMEYISYTTQRTQDEGNFDEMVANAAKVFHPDDVQGFLDVFERQNLIHAFKQGKRIVEHVGRQLGDDGIYRYVRTDTVIMKDGNTDDIFSVSFTHIIGEE